MKTERRAFPLTEVRAVEGEDNALRVEGYAAVFDTEAVIGDFFRERISRGAFRKTLKETDTVALWNHDTSLPLGRASRGTLELREDKHGLKVAIDLPDTTWGQDAFKSIDRGDVEGMSFGFSVVKEEWEEPKKESGKLPRRTLNEVNCSEVSPCTFPAYTTTEVEARALFDARSQATDSADAPDDEESDATTEEPGTCPTPPAGASRKRRQHQALQLVGYKKPEEVKK